MNIFSLLNFIVEHPLNRAEPLKAVKRFVRWQIASRLMNTKIEFPFVEDTKLFAKRGMTGATGNWYCGLHEPHDMGFVLHCLRPDSLFLDVGANVGSYTVLAAGGVGAKVIAVEPIAVTFNHLKANVLLNGLASKVDIHCKGLSSEPGTLRFTDSQDTVNHVLAPNENVSAVEVAVTTIDILCGDRVPTVIKIDVEGHEKAVLQGASKILGSPELIAVLMETNGSGQRYGESDSELISIMSSFGLYPIGYDIFRRQILDKPLPGGNTIFVKDRSKVQALASDAKLYRLVNGYV